MRPCRSHLIHTSATALLLGLQHIFITEHENKTTTPSINGCSEKDIGSTSLWKHESDNIILFHANRLISAVQRQPLWKKTLSQVQNLCRLFVFAWNLRRLLLCPMEKWKWSSVRKGEAKVQSHFYSEDNGPRFLSLSLHLIALLCCEKWWKVTTRMKEALQLRNGH